MGVLKTSSAVTPDRARIYIGGRCLQLADYYCYYSQPIYFARATTAPCAFYCWPATTTITHNKTQTTACGRVALAP